MAKDAQSLLDQAKCYQCYASNGYAAGLMELSLLAQWAGGSPTPPIVFSWAPDSTVALWSDKNGDHTSNLAVFNATADTPSVWRIRFGDGSGITSISGLGKFSGTLVELAANGSLLSNLDLSSVPLMNDLELSGNELTVASVNAILVALAGFGGAPGFADLSGQNPAAPPSGAGAAAATTLTGKGWTLFTD